MQRLDYSKQDQWEKLDSNQSPINLEQTIAKKYSWSKQPLKINFGDSPLEKKLKDTGDQFFLDGTLQLGKKHYLFERMHFHDGSEHFLETKQFDCELHFVAKAKNDSLLVLAILGNVVSQNNISNNLERVLDTQISAKIFNQILSKKLSYFEYKGSLTTPPLLSNVTWIILTQPIAISQNFLDMLHSDFPNNHRELQPVNNREINYYS